MGTLMMSSKERRRLEVMSLIGAGKLSLAKGAGLLNLSVRQSRRSAIPPPAQLLLSLPSIGREIPV